MIFATTEMQIRFYLLKLFVIIPFSMKNPTADAVAKIVYAGMAGSEMENNTSKLAVKTVKGGFCS